MLHGGVLQDPLQTQVGFAAGQSIHPQHGPKTRSKQTQEADKINQSNEQMSNVEIHTCSLVLQLELNVPFTFFSFKFQTIFYILIYICVS